MVRLITPWLLLAALAAAILTPFVRRSGRADPDSITGVFRDPVCGMEVGAEISEEFDGTRWCFCCEPCRDRFVQAPSHYTRHRCPVCALDEGRETIVRLDGPHTATHLGRAFAFDSADHLTRFHLEPGRYFTHTMWGIPRPLFIGSLAGLLVISFLAMGIAALRSRAEAPSSPPKRPQAAEEGVTRGRFPRLNLLRLPFLKRVYASRWVQRLARAALVFLFGVIVAAGLFGSRDAAENIAPVLTWTVWWGALVGLVLYGGHIWCYACPWDTIAGFLQMPPFLRDRFRRPFTLGLRWPRWGRSVALASICLIVFSWIELGFHVSMDPRLTAWLALFILGMTVVCALLFERRSFCRYGCFVGRTIGLYSGIGAVELRHVDTKVCMDCRTRDCFHGNERGAPCPTWEFPGAMQTSTHCLLCAECVRTCPSDNISLFIRPWAADADVEGKPRMDEAILALVILGITAFHGLTMTPAGRGLADWFSQAWGLGGLGGYTVALAAAVLGPIGVFAALVGVGKIVSGESRVPYRVQFVRFAYVHLPIALFYHLAHTSQHLFAEGNRVIALASDPFGWGWNLFGTATMRVPPLLSLSEVWYVQVICIVTGHLLSLWMADRAARRMFSTPGAALRSQIPTLIVQVIFSAYSLWLLLQPMEMRTSAM